MERKSRFGWICLTFMLAGCSSIDSMSGLFKQKDEAKNPPTGQTKVGTSDFSSSKKLKDPIKARLAYASWLEQSGNHEEARATYKKVLDKNSKNTEALLGLARIDRAYGLEEEADAQLRKLLKKFPNDPKVLLAIGQVHASRGELPEAIEKMQAAQKLAPYEKMYEHNLAIIETRAGELDAAIEHFTHSVGKAEGYFNIGYILKEEGRTAEAEKYLNQAMSSNSLKSEDLKRAQTALAELRTRKSDGIQPAAYKPKHSQER